MWKLPLLAAALVAAVFFCIAPVRVAAAPVQPPPKIEFSEAGATVEEVTIETHGVIKPDAVRAYLSLKKGDALEQSAVDRDYRNLVVLGGFRPRLQIDPGSQPRTVKLHWIVTAKLLQSTSHPFYGDQPLTAPIQGVGFIVTSPQLNARGANFSAVSQLSRRANLIRLLYTEPIRVDSVTGRESDFIFNVFGGRGVYRASMPLAINIYSWNTGAEALYLVHGTSGSQLEFGARTFRSTTALPTGIQAATLFPTALHPAHNVLLEAGYSHACMAPPPLWHPPYCKLQYRFETMDAVGGFGVTSRYQTYLADVARYLALGTSTLALHASEWRTGGVIPDSFLVCSTGVRGYPKPFCGTDAETLQAEYRIADAIPGPWHFVLFTETAASRVRAGTQAFAPPNFHWWPDSGVGVIFRGFRLDLAYGKAGGRLTFELQGQQF
jgi:hypothetical protein